MKRLLLLALLALAPTDFARAEPPDGFAGLAWGTKRQIVVDKALTDRCRSTLAIPGLDDVKVLCYGYSLDRLGPVLVTVQFVDDTLQGYTVTVPRDLAAPLRASAREQFGAPVLASEVSETVGWEWPTGTVAFLTRRCSSLEEACLTVVTKIGFDPSWKTARRPDR
jgi:hypothetical protein